ncbi:MAG: branched-chain amino acid ABC transporter permease [Nocardioidaceae bacterium]
MTVPSPGRALAARFAARSRTSRYTLLGIGILIALGLPWFVYPPVALDIVIFALFAMALDLLLGYTGLLSFGHAAFFGSAAYVAGLVSLHLRLPYPLAVLAGTAFAVLLAIPIGYLSVKRSGIYFAMVTLAFAQMVYYVANQWRSVTGGENGLQGVPRLFPGVDLRDPFYFYYAALPLLLIGVAIAWRTVHSPFGKVLVAIRDNPDRVRALGYPVAHYKLLAFVISAGLAGIAGSLYSLAHFFASLDAVDWSMSGKVVVITVLGGVGTLWGSVISSGLIVILENRLSLAGFNGQEIVIGSIFVIVVLAFRRGIWGTVAHLLAGWSRPPAAPEPRPDRTDRTGPRQDAPTGDEVASQESVGR